MSKGFSRMRLRAAARLGAWRRLRQRGRAGKSSGDHWLRSRWATYRHTHAAEFETLHRLLVGTRRKQTHFLTRWLFLRGLGIIYLLAFISMHSQVDGLIGSDGILPAAEYVEVLETAYNTHWTTKGQPGRAVERFWKIPTLCWFTASDKALHALTLGGVALAIFLVCGVAPIPCLILLWMAYLSLSSVSQTFLGYQWDTLILEVGFLAIFLAPGNLRPSLKRESAPPLVVIWLYRLLLIRLVCASGLAKLSSWDPTWWSLTALNYHYETQPIPNVIAWYAHQLPDWCQQLSVGGMFFAQLLLPLLVFAPRRVRLLPFWGTVLVQVLILATGNYCFFNLLALLLCILLLDDVAVQRCMPWRRRDDNGRPQRVWAKIVRTICVVLLVAVTVPVGWWQMKQRALRLEMTERQQKIVGYLAPFRSINSYGLFAGMTTSRPELIVEGSHDGKEWQTYEFKWKPSDLTVRPRQVAPHQPRLDWQMWFEALSALRQLEQSEALKQKGQQRPREMQPNDWFRKFAVRLLEGNETVLDLLQENPFTEKPPTFIRVLIYDYKFTNFDERREGNWWRRELLGTYWGPKRLPPSRPAR